MYDLLIRNARIIDGTGAPSLHGALAVQDSRITEVGDTDGLAHRVIDADGLAVAPGFIDIHTHYDAQVAWDPLLTPSCYHGTTTVLMSNCGYSMAPVRPHDRDYVMGTFSVVEDVAKATLIEGLPWEWETLPEYLDWLDGRGLGINVAAQVAHSAIRRYVLGSEAHERAATPEEVEEMRGLLRQGLEAGAFGFSTSRVAHQKGEFGEPIPSYVAEESEIFRLADVLRELDRGIIGINPRTKALDFNQADKDQLFKLAKASGRVVNWNEFNHRWDHPGQWRELLDYMENAQRLGAQVYAVMRCQRMDLPFDLRHTRAFDQYPRWRDFMALPLDQRLRRLDDDAIRSSLAEEITPALTGETATGGFFRPRFSSTAIASAATQAYKPLEGRLLAEAAQERGVTPGELLVAFARDERMETQFVFLGVTNGDDAAVEAMLKSPATVTGISDAGAHLHARTGVDYPTYFLGRWVREKEVFSLEQAIATLTSVPAKLVGLEGRGVIAPGAFADLCIFDPDTIDREPLEIVDDLPGGESRQVRRARGIEWVIVNGRPLLHRGELTGELAGRVLRSC